MDFCNKRRPLRGCYEYNTDITDKRTVMQNGFHRKFAGAFWPSDKKRTDSKRMKQKSTSCTQEDKPLKTGLRCILHVNKQYIIPVVLFIVIIIQ